MTKAVFVFKQGGSECMSTLDVSHAGMEEAEAAYHLSTFMKDAWMVYAAQDCELDEVRLGEAVYTVTGGGGLGELTSCPSNCALIVQKNTSTNVRGRFMLPGISEADVNASGVVGAELRGLLVGTFADARTALIAEGVTPNVVSMTGGIESVRAVTSFVPRPLIATLRNRLLGR